MNTALKVPNTLIFGYGNPGRGDDALGPACIEQLMLEDFKGPKGSRVEYMTDFQLQIEHAEDLRGRNRVLFIDAHIKAPPPYLFERIQADPDAPFTTHAMRPQGILAIFEALRGPPPDTFLLGIRGETFELGAPLSKAAQGHLEKALTLLRALLNDPSLEIWEKHAKAFTLAKSP